MNNSIQCFLEKGIPGLEKIKKCGIFWWSLPWQR